MPAPFVLDALTFAVAAWLIYCLRLPSRTAPPKRAIWTETKEGGAWILAHREILQLAIMLGFLNAMNIAFLTVMILFAQEVLGLSAAGYGILLTAGAAGGVIGGVTCPTVARTLGNRLSILVALALIAASFAMAATTSSTWITGFCLGLSMFGGVLWNIVTVSYRQRHIPDALLGRVNSIYRFFGWGMMPLGALIGGGLMALTAPEIGREMAIRLVFITSAIGTLCLWIYAGLALKITQK